MKKSFSEFLYSQLASKYLRATFGLLMFALFVYGCFTRFDTSAFAATMFGMSTTGGSGVSRVQPTRNNNRPSSNLQIPGLQHIITNAQIAASVNQMPIPPSITIQAVSGAAGVATRVFILNQDLLNNITDNTSGANSITYVYQDTFAGRLISNLLAQDRAGMGAICFGIAMRMVVTASGAGSPNGIGASNPYFATFNAFGNALPLNMNMTSNQTRMDQDTSIEVVPVAQNLGRFVQYSFIIPVLTTATVTLYMTPNFTI